MKSLSIVFLLVLEFASAGPSLCQDIIQSRPKSSPQFFPKGWIRGYTEFSVAPPHNEPDLNRCQSTSGHFGGALAHCTAFARFVGSGYVEFRPLGAPNLRRIFLFVDPHLFLGSNVPQFHYSFSAAPMALDRSVGIGVALPKNFEIRLTEHRVMWMGRYQRNLGRADLGKNGPFGSYTTVSARWYFGGYSDNR